MSGFHSEDPLVKWGALAVLALLVGAGLILSPGPAHSAAGILLLAAGAVAGIRAGAMLAFVAAVGFHIAYWDISSHATLAPLLVPLEQVAHVITPALFVHVLLPTRGRSRVRPLHLYAPMILTVPAAVLMGLGDRGLVLTSRPEGLGVILAIAGVLYAGAAVVALVDRLHQPAPEPSPAARGAALESEGRFAVASRAYAREGQTAMGAEAARRAGDWRLAAKLYREAGDVFQSAEMTYRDGQLEEAAELYLQARAEPAAARVLEQIGKWREAAAAWERAGDLAGAVRALEAGGLRPSADILQRVGRLEEAVMAWVAESRLDRAAHLLEHELHDFSRAAQAYLHIGQARHAGELLEQLGRREQAIAAYRSDPAARLDAIRLCLDAGDKAQADAIARELSSKEITDLDDENALLVLARLHQQNGRVNEAIALLQRARNLPSCGGSTRLMLGQLLLGRGLTDLAETELRAAAEQPLDPAQQMEAAYLLGRVLEDLGRGNEAAEVFRELAQKDLGYRDVEERYRRLRAAAPPAGPPTSLSDL